MRESCFAHLFSLVLVLLAGTAVIPSAAAAEYDEVIGWLSVLWGDGRPDNPQAGPILMYVAGDEGSRTQIKFSDDFLAMTGGLALVNGKKVKVWLNKDSDKEPDTLRRAVAITVLEDERAVRAVGGHQPWVSVLCKFSNISTEPKPLSYFQEMFANSPGRLDHYWREVSYSTIDIVGSVAVDWISLGFPQTKYTAVPGEGCFTGAKTDLNTLFDDCTAAADALVDFSNGGSGGFAGINLMFNGDLDGCAWGGGHFADLDGVGKVWRTTWEPPWGYDNVSVMAHEMGHGFGLPHSNNADNDSDPYDNPWDVMSDTWNFSTSDATFGTKGKHTISYHKDMLGWIPSSQRLLVDSSGVTTITIDDLAQGSTSNYRMAQIAIPGSSNFYTVEVRGQTGDYDGNLPGDAVIIHEVDLGRSEPAWLVDPVDPANGGDEGAMWRVGETFEDAANEISVEVVASTTDGFQVKITYGASDIIFADGFESSGVDKWNNAVE